MGRFASRWILHLIALASMAAAASAQTQARPQGHIRDTIASGKLIPFTLFDSSYRRERKIWIYTPAGYNANAATPYPLLVAFDGDEYQETIPLPRILDTLAAERHAPASSRCSSTTRQAASASPISVTRTAWSASSGSSSYRTCVRTGA